MTEGLLVTIIAPTEGRRRIRHYALAGPNPAEMDAASAALGLAETVAAVNRELGGVQIKVDIFLQATVEGGARPAVNGVPVAPNSAWAVGEIKSDLGRLGAGEVAAAFVDFSWNWS